MPVGGDALKATNKIGKFALKNADDIGIYAEILSFANKNFPDAVKKLGKNDEFVLATNKVSELGEKKITKKQYQEMLKSWTQAGIENAFESDGNPNINEYIDGIIDTTGNVDVKKMKRLRNAIQRGKFTQENIREISRRMAELGITKEYETEMKNMHFGKYLSNMVGDRPADMINSHAHHILFKTGNGPAQQALVEEGQAILRKYEIDPIIGLENLIWAPNAVIGQHDVVALEKVVDTLRSIDEEGGSYDDIVDALAELGDIASQR